MGKGLGPGSEPVSWSLGVKRQRGDYGVKRQRGDHGVKRQRGEHLKGSWCKRRGPSVCPQGRSWQ